MRGIIFGFLASFFTLSTVAYAGLFIQSLPLPETMGCAEIVRGEDPQFPRIIQHGEGNQMYESTGYEGWELDDYGDIHRLAISTRSQSEHFVVEEIVPTLDAGPSPAWIQTLKYQKALPEDLNHLASDPRGVTYADIMSFMRQMSLVEHTHPLREAHLRSQRLGYLSRIDRMFFVAMKNFKRRPWFSEEFEKGARETLFRTLRTASYISVTLKSGRPLAVMRLVRVHNGLLTLTHKKSGRQLKILGNAEFGWGVDEKFYTSKAGLFEAFEVKKHLRAFTESSSQVVEVDSEYEPQEMIRLPVEVSMGQKLPRDFKELKLRGLPGFEDSTLIEIEGEEYEVNFSHAVLIEPGMFAIEKNELRPEVYAEFMMWVGRFITTPPLPKWVSPNDISYWTYNDLPIYTAFGLVEDNRLESIEKHSVTWKYYTGGLDQIRSSLTKVTQSQASGSDRSQRIIEYMKQQVERW